MNKEIMTLIFIGIIMGSVLHGCTERSLIQSDIQEEIIGDEDEWWVLRF